MLKNLPGTAVHAAVAWLRTGRFPGRCARKRGSLNWFIVSTGTLICVLLVAKKRLSGVARSLHEQIT
ncbi:hypothetical protein MJ581_06205 [Escherichia coli]|nr:hypothetical protein MJ581_06205 [Escherichia coli]